MNRWRKISTAPRDGTPILIWQPDRNYGQRYDDARYAIGYWRVDDDETPRGGSWGNRNSSEVSPTHWMPLPNPPNGSVVREFAKRKSPAAKRK